MTTAQLNALWARIKAIFAEKTELANKQDTLTAGTGISIDNNVISATGGGGGVEEIETQLYINLGDYADGEYEYSELPNSSANANWIYGIAPELEGGVYLIHVGIDTAGEGGTWETKPVIAYADVGTDASNPNVTLTFELDGVYFEVVFTTGTTKTGSVTAYKLSHLVANEENKFYLVDLSVDDLLASPLAQRTIAKLSAMRVDNESYGKLILFHGGTDDGNTLVPATITSYGSQFDMYLYYDGTNIHVTADPTSTTWEVTQTTPYVKPSGGIPSTDLSSSVQTSLGKADSALQDESVFVAEYGVTTGNDIAEAYSDNKALFCRRGSIIYNCTNYGSSTVTFDHIGNNYAQRVVYTWATDTWDVQAQITFEQVSNRKNTLTGNETSSTYYPTTKAVADYAEAKTNKVTSLSSSSTDVEYPSAKAVYDEIGPIDDLLDEILGDVDAALDVLNGEVI